MPIVLPCRNVPARHAELSAELFLTHSSRCSADLDPLSDIHVGHRKKIYRRKGYIFLRSKDRISIIAAGTDFFGRNHGSPSGSRGQGRRFEHAGTRVPTRRYPRGRPAVETGRSSCSRGALPADRTPLQQRRALRRVERSRRLGLRSRICSGAGMTQRARPLTPKRGRLVSARRETSSRLSAAALARDRGEESRLALQAAFRSTRESVLRLEQMTGELLQGPEVQPDAPPSVSEGAELGGSGQ